MDTRQQAEQIDRLFQLVIAAVRCGGSTPTGSYADTIEHALTTAYAAGRQAALREAAGIAHSSANGLAGIQGRIAREIAEAIEQRASEEAGR